MYKLISFWLCTQLFYYHFINRNLVFKLGVSISLDRIIFALVVMSFLIQSKKDKTKSLGISKVEYCMIFFAIICTFSYITHGADSSLEKNRFLTTLFNLIYFPFTAYFVAKNIRYSREGVKVLLKTLFLIGVYLSFTAVFERYLHSLVWPKYILDSGIGDHAGRARGPFLNSAILSRYLIVTFLGASLMILYIEGFKKVLLLVSMLIMTGGIYLASTRSPMLAFAIITIVFCYFATGKIRKAVMAIGGIVFIAGFLGFGDKISFFGDNLFTKRQSTIQYRYTNYNIDIEMIKNNFLTGIGYGRFKSEWRKYYPESQDDEYNLDHGNHNTFLGLFAETGIIGIGMYFAVFLLILKLCIRKYCTLYKTQIFEKSLILIAILVMILYFIVGQFADLRFHQLLQNTMFLFLGLSSNDSLGQTMKKHYFKRKLLPV